MGRRHKKRKTKGSNEEPEELVKAPHSFVIKRGDVGKHVEQLLGDFRQVMEPFTASKLRVRKKNVLKDFVSMSSYLNVSHLAIFTKTPKSPYFRLIRMPRGPTITYKVVEYTVSSDVISKLRRPEVNSKLFQTAPLLVLNGFTGAEEDVKFRLMTSMWRNMFPSIDIHKVQLSKIRRCVLLNRDPETGLIDFRHYAIKVKPVGLSRMVRKLMAGKKIPDLGQYASVEDAMERSRVAELTESEGEAEDEIDETKHVTLAQRLNKRGNMINEKSALRLVELGPRMKLELVKIEEGIMAGEVLYHSYITKTSEEVKTLKQRAQDRNFLKMSRRREQEENVKRKMAQREQERVAQRQRVLLQQLKHDDESSKRLKLLKKEKVKEEEEEDSEEEKDTTTTVTSNITKKKNKPEEKEVKGNDDSDLSDYDISDDELFANDDDEDAVPDFYDNDDDD